MHSRTMSKQIAIQTDSRHININHSTTYVHEFMREQQSQLTTVGGGAGRTESSLFKLAEGPGLIILFSIETSALLSAPLNREIELRTAVNSEASFRLSLDILDVAVSCVSPIGFGIRVGSDKKSIFEVRDVKSASR
jgi:hypothetical protein